METPLAVTFGIVTNFAMLILFIRFMMQFAGIKSDEPIVQASYQASKVVDVFSRIFPDIYDKRISMAALILMLLVRLIDVAGMLVLSEHGYNPIQLVYVGSISLIGDFFQMCRYLIFASIIASFIVMLSEKSGALTHIINALVEPILAPFRKIMPNLGMIDLSPMLAFFVFMLADNALEIISAHMLPLIMPSPSLISFTLKQVLGFHV